MHGKVRNHLYCRSLFLAFALGSFSLMCLHGPNQLRAQEKYPSQPIKIVVTNAPGGHGDLIARIVAEFLARELKVPVLVENRQGAGGMLGCNMVLRARADGHTILAGGDTNMCTGILQNPNPTYNPFTDFSFICGLGRSAAAYGVYGSSPFKTLTDFMRAAKANPGKLSCGVTNIGSPTHLSLILLRKYSEADFKIVPYKGNPDAIPALLGKHIDMLILTTSSFLPQAESGAARILAVSSRAPGSSLKILAEEGFSQPAFQAVEGFSCYAVSANTPKPVFDRLALAFQRIAKNPEVNAKLMGIGSIPSYRDPAEFKEFLREEWLVIGSVLEELGLKKYQGKID